MTRLFSRAFVFVSSLLVLSLLARPALAVDDPTLVWWTYETPHFRVTYPEHLDPVARRIATLCEDISGRMTAEMQYAPSSKTEVLITDNTDGANGSATPIPYDAVRLFVTAPDDISTLGDYDDWYLGLITHEYTHILHTGNISGLAAVANGIIGKTLSPNSAQPRWIIEGLATVQESKKSSAGRMRSSLFDTYLRADVLEDNIAGLDQISGGALRWPYGNLFYLYGSRFLRWISDVYGPDVFPAISADYGATTIPFGINRAVRRVTGRTYEDLYEGFITHQRALFEKQRDEVDQRGRREGVRLTFHGHETKYPRFVPKALLRDPSKDEIVYFRDDSDHRRGIYRFELGNPSQEGERAAEIFIRTTTDAYASFTPEGGVVFTDIVPDKNVYARHDLFDIPKGTDSTFGTEKWRRQLTFGKRADYPDVSPDGRHVAYTVNNAGTTKLYIAERDADGTLRNAHVLIDNAPFEQAYTPRFSPDGTMLAYSAWSSGGYRDIRVIDLKSGSFRDVTRDRAMDMHPVFSADSKTLYFSSDRTGIFNVYAMTLATGELRMVTNTIGAALAPDISPDGKTLVYMGYTKAGFDVFAMALDPTLFLDAPASVVDNRPPANPEPPEIALERKRYNPFITFRPQSYFFDIAPGNYSGTAITISASANDIVGWQSLGASVRFDPGAPEPRVDLDYVYAGLPVNLAAGFTRTPVPRTRGYRLGGKDIRYDEIQTSFSTGLSAPLNSAYVSQSIALSYNATYYEPDLPFLEAKQLDPYGTIANVPTSGFLSQFRFAYALSTAEGAIDTAGAARGFSLRVAVSLADSNTGSDTSLYTFEGSATGYIQMPWPGDHTLALRFSGGTSTGEYARRGNYFVGGYDLKNTTPLDTLVLGAYDGAFVLRGYAPGAFAGSSFVLGSAEYRAPLYRPNWGPSTLPIFFERLDGSVFFDVGGAFSDFQADRVRFAYNGSPLYVPDLHASFGTELWLKLTLAYRIGTSVRLGYAYGLDKYGVENGQVYFITNSAF